MYTSSVLSWTIAPCGQAAWISSRRRTAAPGAAASRARMRNSVGVSSAVSPRLETACVGGIEAHAAGFERQVGAAPAQQRAQPRDELGERERLREVVVAARREAGQPVGERVAGGEEEHRRADAARPQRLDDVAPVRVRQADVDDERVRLLVRERCRAARAAVAAVSTAKPSSVRPRRSSERSSPSSSSTNTRGSITAAPQATDLGEPAAPLAAQEAAELGRVK